MKKNRKKDKCNVICLMLLLCVFSFFCLNDVKGKYSSKITSDSEVQVALFSHDESISLSDENVFSGLIPGESVTYNVKVSNYKQDKVSEVTLKYNLEIITTGNLPLEYEVFYYNSLKQWENLGTFSESETNKSMLFSNDEMKFTYGVKKDNTYKIVVSWPEADNDAKYAGIPDDIVMNVNIEQVD